MPNNNPVSIQPNTIRDLLQATIPAPALLTPPHPLPIDQLAHLFPCPALAHISSHSLDNIIPGPSPWDPHKQPIVVLFLELMTALEHLQPDTSTLILLCFIWATPPTQAFLFCMFSDTPDDWSVFCNIFRDELNHPRTLSIHDGRAMITCFRDRVLRYSHNDTMFENLMTRFRIAFNASCDYPLHNLLYPDPESASRIEPIINDTIARVTGAAQSLEHSVVTAETHIRDLQLLSDIFPTIAESLDRHPIQLRMQDILISAAAMNTAILRDIRTLLRTIDTARNLYDVLSTQLPQTPDPNLIHNSGRLTPTADDFFQATREM